MHGRAAPGWYPDQAGRVPLRWWDGARWTAWRSDGVRVWTGQVASPVAGPEDLPALRFVEDVFLVEARRRGVITEPHQRALTGLSRELARDARTWARPTDLPAPVAAQAGPVPVGSTAGPLPVGSTAGPVPAAPTAGPVPAIPVVPRTPSSPGRIARWWAGTRERFDVDLTVHGLAYLGVLLLFVGVFGLVAFAFGDVAPAMRPVAELAVAVVPFVAAWVLARSGARFVARTLVAVGGLLLPVMLVTSVVDGYGFPPDLHGAALPAVTGPVAVTLALAYAGWSVRRPSSGLGAMVAPVLWFAAAMGAVGLARPVPRGEGVAVPGSAQVAVLALAVLGTTALARTVVDRAGRTVVAGGEPGDAVLPPAWRLAAGALAAATPGAVVAAVLALVAGASEGWPVLPFVVTVLALAGTVALTGRFGPATVDLALLAGWGLVLLRVVTLGEAAVLLSADVPLRDALDAVRPWLLLVVALLGVGLAEVVLRRARSLSVWPSAASTGDQSVAVAEGRAQDAQARAVRARGVVLAVVVWVLLALVAGGLGGGWWTVAAATVLMVWAAFRRAHVARGGAAVALDVAAALGPGLAVLALWGTAPGAVALLAAAVLVLAAVPLARRAHGRRDGDRFWAWWSTCAAVPVLVGSVVELAVGRSEPLSAARAAVPVAVPVALGVLAVALVLAPWRGRTRVLLVAPVVWWAWIAACVVAEAPRPVMPVGLAVAGLVVVVAAHGLGRAARHTAPMLGLAGHVTGALAFLVTVADGWQAVTALACATAGWAVTAVRGEGGRSPIGTALDRRAAIGGRHVPWVLTSAGAPLTLWAVLHETGLRLDSPWAVAVPAGTAVVYAAATRVVGARRIGTVLPWAAFVAAVLALGMSTRLWPLVAALGALVVQAVLTRGRHAVMVWAAWAAVAPLVGLTAWGAAPAIRELGRATVVAGTPIAVGALLVLGALLADRARPTDPRLLPRRTGALAPALLGAGQVVLGVVAAAVVPDPTTAGWLLLAGAAAIGALAAITGVGAVGAVAVLLAWAAAVPVLGRDHPGPWAHVAVTAALLALAQGLAASGPPRVRWARWDVPLAVAAAFSALAAVSSAAPPDQPLILPTVGALCVATAVRLHRRAVLAELLAAVGTLLVILGAAGEGPGWTAVALVVLAAAHTALAAVREAGRTARRWVGALAAAAAWGALVTATGLGAQWATDITALTGALVVTTVVGAVAAGLLARAWVAPWGVVGGVLSLAGLLRALPDPAVVAREWDAWDAISTARVVDSVGAAPVVASWWLVAAWLTLAAAAVLAARAVPWAWWLEVGVLTLLGGVLTVFSVTGASRLTQLTVEVGLSAAAAVALVVVARSARGGPAGRLRRPWTLLGAATTALACVATLGGAGEASGASMLAGALAAVAVQAAAAGVAWRLLGLRAAAPALGWVAWAVYASQVLRGDQAAWYTIPVGLALLAVVAVWRADRRDRGLDPSGGGVAGLELTGIAFLVVASFVAAFGEAVVHAFVAAGIGVAVAVCGLLTRVRRRFLAGVGIVLAGVVLAVALPLVALLPAWGAAGAWVLVAVVGVVAVVAATFLERGRAVVRDGRARLLDATTGWE